MSCPLPWGLWHVLAGGQWEWAWEGSSQHKQQFLLFLQQRECFKLMSVAFVTDCSEHLN